MWRLVVGLALLAGHVFGARDPCNPSPCGSNAICKVKLDGKNMTASCSCIDNYIGNPYVGCMLQECIDNKDCPSRLHCEKNECRDPCDHDVCGVDANCDVINHLPECTCPPSYSGDPYTICYPAECKINKECRVNKACFENKCINPCQLQTCGIGADCRVKNHNPTCDCPEGYTGDPYIACQKIFLRDSPGITGE